MYSMVSLLERDKQSQLSFSACLTSLPTSLTKSLPSAWQKSVIPHSSDGRSKWPSALSDKPSQLKHAREGPISSVGVEMCV